MTDAGLKFAREDAHIESAIYVVHFRNVDREIRFKQADVEKAFRAFMNAQSSQSNVPDDFDPGAPRIVFSSGNKTILVSQLACQLTMSFPEVGKAGLDEQWQIIAKNVRNFHRGVLVLKPKSELAMSSFVCPINFPSEVTSEELGQLICRKFIRSQFDPAVASASVALGYRRGDFYVNVNAGAYEKRKFEIPPGQTQMTIRVDKAPIAERGISLQVDVNTRPRFMDKETAEVATAEEVLEIAQSYAEEQIQFFTSNEA